MALIRLHDATLGYPGVRVLTGVECAFDPGNFVGVLGGNGSGKTTLLRTLLGALPLLEGRQERAPHLRIAYVPQQAALDPLFPLSVSEVVRMGLYRGRQVLGRIARSARAEVGRHLEQVGMEARARELFGTLSGGQKQRVLVARALVSRPNLLLLDEPIAGVDARAARFIADALDDAGAGGVAVVLVTHQPANLSARANGLLAVQEGTVRSLDPAAVDDPALMAEVLL